MTFLFVLPTYLDQKAGDLHMMPRVSFSNATVNINDMGGGVNTGDQYPVINIRGTTGTLRAALTKITGAHTLNFGWDERRYWTATAGPGNTRFDVPYGNSLDGVYFAARDQNPNYPRNFKPARQQCWRVGIQHQFSKNILLEVSYNDSWSKVPIASTNSSVGQPVNYVPQQYFGRLTSQRGLSRIIQFNLRISY